MFRGNRFLLVSRPYPTVQSGGVCERYPSEWDAILHVAKLMVTMDHALHMLTYLVDRSFKKRAAFLRAWKRPKQMTEERCRTRTVNDTEAQAALSFYFTSIIFRVSLIPLTVKVYKYRPVGIPWAFQVTAWRPAGLTVSSSTRIFWPTRL